MEQIAIPTKQTKPKELPTAHQQLFVGTMISLSWQLLIVVLAPAIGGHFLDQKTDREPLFTILGYVLAISLAALITYRAYKTMTTESNTEVKHD